MRCLAGMGNRMAAVWLSVDEVRVVSDPDNDSDRQRNLHHLYLATKERSGIGGDSVLINFNIGAWAASVLYVVVSAIVSRIEGTFASDSVTLGFVNHGGMWGDFIILPIMIGIIVPQLPRPKIQWIPVAIALLVCSAILTVLIHVQWAVMGAAQGSTDHVFPSHRTGVWYRDMSLAGYLHLFYMSGVLALVFAYALAPMPRSTIHVVSGLLTIHLFLGQVQPAWYSTGTIWAAQTVVPTVITVLIVWLVALWKI